jgi:hypothetical protein
MRMQSRMARQRFCHVSSLSVGVPMSDPLELGVVTSPAIWHLLKQSTTLNSENEKGKEQRRKRGEGRTGDKNGVSMSIFS